MANDELRLELIAAQTNLLELVERARAGDNLTVSTTITSMTPAEAWALAHAAVGAIAYPLAVPHLGITRTHNPEPPV